MFFISCCYNNTVSVDYASVDFVITFVILATLKILIDIDIHIILQS